LAAFAGLLLFGARAAAQPAAPEARAVAIGDDRCPACGMAVVDARFAAQARTEGGRIIGNVLGTGSIRVGQFWSNLTATHRVITTALEANTRNGAPATTSNGVSMVFETGTTVTPYQRVGTTSLDVTEAGKRDCYYLFHDLSDDVLQATLPNLGQNVTLATGDNDGGTITANQTVGAGVRNLPNTKSRLFAHLLIYKSLVPFAKDFVTRWLLQKSGKAP
jgi:hypothetical protein